MFIFDTVLMFLFTRWTVICELEDDDAPAHPQSWVTPETLRSAFADIGTICIQIHQDTV